MDVCVNVLPKERKKNATVNILNWKRFDHIDGKKLNKKKVP